MKDKLHLEIDNLALEFIINDVAKKRLHKIVDEIEERHTGNPVCPHCTVDMIQDVEGYWVCDCANPTITEVVPFEWFDGEEQENSDG